MIASVFISLAVLAADVNGDQTIDSGDLAVVFAQWGGAGSADINGDGVVNARDMSKVLAAWGWTVGQHDTGDRKLRVTPNGEWIASSFGIDFLRLRDRDSGHCIDQYAFTFGLLGGAS